MAHNLYPTTNIPLLISYNLYPKTYIPQYISHNLYPTIHIPQLISHRSPLAQRIRSDLKIVNVRLSLLKRRYSGVKSPQWTPPFQVLLLVPWKFTLRLHPYLVFTPSKMLDGCFASPLATKGTGPGLRVSEKLKKIVFFHLMPPLISRVGFISAVCTVSHNSWLAPTADSRAQAGIEILTNKNKYSLLKNRNKTTNQNNLQIQESSVYCRMTVESH